MRHFGLFSNTVQKTKLTSFVASLRKVKLDSVVVVSPKNFCFFQIHNQFPFCFEFTEKFLVTLADHSYFSNFGTFLCDSEFERNLMGVKEHTVSLWSYLNRPEILSNYLNCLYEPNSKVIWPSVAPVSLVSNRIFAQQKFILAEKIRWEIFSESRKKT